MRSFLALCALVAVAFAASADDRPYAPTKVTVAVGADTTVRFLSPAKLDDAGRWDDTFDSESVATDPDGFTIKFTGKVKGSSALILTAGGKLVKVTVEVIEAAPVVPPPPAPAPVPIPVLPSAAPPAAKPAMPKAATRAIPPAKVGAVSRPTLRPASPAMTASASTTPATNVRRAAVPNSSGIATSATFPASSPATIPTSAPMTAQFGTITRAADSGCATASG